MHVYVLLPDLAPVDCLVVRSSALIESVFPSEAARGAHQLSSSTGGCLPVCTAEAEGSASTRTALICGTRHWAGVHTPLYAMTQGTAAAPWAPAAAEQLSSVVVTASVAGGGWTDSAGM
jgi:hypothetical protein